MVAQTGQSEQRLVSDCRPIDLAQQATTAPHFTYPPFFISSHPTPVPSWQPMSNSIMSNISKQKSSPCPANGRQTVGDGAFTTDATPSVLAVCHMQGNDSMYYYSTTFSGGPGPIPKPFEYSHNLATPPLTPDDDDDDDALNLIKRSNDALDLLATLFPHDSLNALPYAKSVSISTPGIGTSFDGVVLELPGKSKTFIVALLDLADEHLQCSALVIALEKGLPGLGDLLHSLIASQLNGVALVHFVPTTHHGGTFKEDIRLCARKLNLVRYPLLIKPKMIAVYAVYHEISKKYRKRKAAEEHRKRGAARHSEAIAEAGHRKRYMKDGGKKRGHHAERVVATAQDMCLQAECFVTVSTELRRYTTDSVKEC
ncbi:hypothetical protein EW146_g3448 [Bondarzewia mesenterica]|uniref:Uncharacterized protein n=1 Tax=Bondarzewia mesenterica TaxID=1095465 RepID=A0A4S4LXH4_9AGAM|nr:hypothetical protein EW146_g3448 [Bondarzewia mesenterica]